MIPPVRCFTCGAPIPKASWDTYIGMIQPENHDDTLTNPKYETGVRPIGHKVDLPQAQRTPEYITLNYLGIRKMCCRRMYMSSVDIFNKL